MVRHAVAALTLLVALAWPSEGFAQRATRGLHADRLSTTIDVRPDGSLDVVEQITFRFTGRTFREVERRVPVRRTDGLTNVSVWMDGQPVAEGDDTGQAEIRMRRQELRVIWRFTPRTDTAHTFEVRYRALNALRVSSGRGALSWHVLPTRHRYAISEAEAVLRLQDPLTSLTGPAMEADGWTWVRQPGLAWVARKTDLDVDERAVLTDAVDVSASRLATPQWQFDEERARQLAPAFIIGAIVIVVMGVGVVVMMRLRYHQPRIDVDTAVPASAGSLPPALGTALRSGHAHFGLSQVSATLFDLLSKNIIGIEETSPRGTPDRSRTFDLTFPNREPRTLAPHERVLFDKLSSRAKGGRLALKSARQHLLTGHGAFREAGMKELQAAGLLDPERLWASRSAIGAGLVTCLVGLAGLVVMAVTLSHLGGAIFLVPGAVMLVGVVIMVAGQSFRTVSGSGAILAAQWEARARHLRAEAKAGRAADLANEWLPVAIGAGLGQQFGKSGASVAWLHGVHTPSVVLMSIISSGGGAGGAHGAGAMGGGVAGGGGFSGAR